MKQLLGLAVLMALLPASATAERTVELHVLAPGVYAKQVADAPDAPKGQRIGANQGFVVMADGVLVIEPSYAFEARWLEEDIRGVTPLPVRWVFSTHFHPDHSRAAALMAGERGEILAPELAREPYENWLSASAQRQLARDPGAAPFRLPDRYFESTLSLGSGSTRVELIPMGGGHAQGEAVAWLPELGVLFAGDLCVELPDVRIADAGEWIRGLDRLRALPVKLVVPGHGPLGGPELLAQQQSYLRELRDAIAARMRAGTTLHELKNSLELPWFRDRGGQSIQDYPGQITQVYRELGGDPSSESRLKRYGPIAAAAALLVALVGAFVWKRRSAK